ncbi:hypothetical protein OAM15_00160 [Pelagibacteraceae bacterium]|nr:hypothetical protein [Pelagibacteraceae bacterium]
MSALFVILLGFFVASNLNNVPDNQQQEEKKLKHQRLNLAQRKCLLK